MPHRPLWKRVPAGLGAALILLCSALVTIGTSLVAPLGVLAVRVLARRRGKAASGLASWIGATSAACVAFVLLVGALLAMAPPGTLHDAFDAAKADSVAAHTPPPAWVTRLFPQASQPRPAGTERLVRSPVFRGYFMVVSIGLAIALFGSIAGTAGWVAAWLLGYAFGRVPADATR